MAYGPSCLALFVGVVRLAIGQRYKFNPGNNRYYTASRPPCLCVKDCPAGPRGWNDIVINPVSSGSLPGIEEVYKDLNNSFEARYATRKRSSKVPASLFASDIE